MVTSIILTVIGVAASVITLFLLIIKFVKEPLDKRIDGVDKRMDGVDKKVDRVETNLSTQIDGVDKKVDKLCQLPRPEGRGL